jgi:hypothetical protein
MKKSLYTLVLSLWASFGICQCSQYFIYESFSTVLPTQKGTWINTSVLYGTTSSTARTGTNYLTFNAVNDAIRLPQVSNPGVLTFYYRRSSTSTGTPRFAVETSPNGTTWTERLSLTTFSTTYALASIDLGALGLSNIHIRIIDRRASGSAERYIDDLGLTSTNNTENTLIPFLSSCSQTLNVDYTYTITDNIGPAGPINGNYSNSLDRTITFSPSDNTKKLNITFDNIDLETDYDYLYVHNGANTSAPLLATLTGTTTPSDITATNTNGQLTVRWVTDVSNVGSWGGFMANITTITPLPVELIKFEATSYPYWDVISWSTASESNSSHFDLEISEDGNIWNFVAKKQAAGNSQAKINYSYVNYNSRGGVFYYILRQYDIDGQNKTYGPIAVNRTSSNKKIVKYVNILGQEVEADYKGVVFEVYEDGSSKKIIR